MRNLYHCRAAVPAARITFCPSGADRIRNGFYRLLRPFICLLYRLESPDETTGVKTENGENTRSADQSFLSDTGNSPCEDINVRAARILDTYGNSILRLAYTYVHNLSDAEDIVQDTLIRFLKAAPVFENAVHEKAWLFHVAANVSKNRIEYNRLRETDELAEELEAEESEDLSFVWDAVKELPEKYREVIHLFYHEGYPTAQIAEILGRKDATIRSDLRRGREKLREILKEAYDFE